jgi:NADPH:quinone reductase-like Zn-dependent oxidoreductase
MASPVMKISSGDVIFKQATVKGFWGSKVSSAMEPARRAALLGELVTRVADGTITLPVSETYSFDRISEAATANFEPGRVGKVLLRP